MSLSFNTTIDGIEVIYACNLKGGRVYIPTALHRRRSGRRRLWQLRVEMAVDKETDGKNDDLQDESANVKNTIDPHRALRATGRNDKTIPGGPRGRRDWCWGPLHASARGWAHKRGRLR